MLGSGGVSPSDTLPCNRQLGHFDVALKVPSTGKSHAVSCQMSVTNSSIRLFRSWAARRDILFVLLACWHLLPL